MAYFDTATGTWIPVPATYDRKTQTLTAVSNHLSIWTVLRVDSGKVLNAIKSSLLGFLGISPSAAQPSCPNSTTLAADGIKVISDSGDLIKWCVGESSQGSPLLITANDRRYMMESDYPTAWPMQRTTAPSLSDDVVAAVAHLMSQATQGRSAVIIPGSESVEYSPPSGASGEVESYPSPGAYLADALVYGLQTLAMTAGRVPGGPPVNPTTSAKALDLALESADCANTLYSLVRSSVTSASGAGARFRTDLDLAMSCLGPAWESAYGISGFLVQFIEWLVNGVKLVVQGIHSAIDSVIYWRTYRIALSSKAIPVLGHLWAPEQMGFGTVKPAWISYGGDPTSQVTGIAWQSWGGPTAIGIGMSDYVEGSEIVADGTEEPITVVAGNPGECEGKLAYRDMEWYYPQHGEKFDPSQMQDICTGTNPNGPASKDYAPGVQAPAPSCNPSVFQSLMAPGTPSDGSLMVKFYACQGNFALAAGYSSAGASVSLFDNNNGGWSEIGEPGDGYCLAAATGQCSVASEDLGLSSQMIVSLADAAGLTVDSEGDVVVPAPS